MSLFSTEFEPWLRKHALRPPISFYTSGLSFCSPSVLKISTARTDSTDDNTPAADEWFSAQTLAFCLNCLKKLERPWGRRGGGLNKVCVRPVARCLFHKAKDSSATPRTCHDSKHVNPVTFLWIYTCATEGFVMPSNIYSTRCALAVLKLLYILIYKYTY